MTKVKVAKHLSSPKFKLFFNLWLYTAGGTKLFYISHRHLLQSSIFCMFALAQQKTKNPYSTLIYRDLFCVAGKQDLENLGKCRGKTLPSSGKLVLPMFQG